MSLPVLRWRTGTAGSGQQQVGPWATAAQLVHLYPHFCEILNKLLQTDETGTQIIAKTIGNI